MLPGARPNRPTPLPPATHAPMQAYRFHEAASIAGGIIDRNRRELLGRPQAPIPRPATAVGAVPFQVHDFESEIKLGLTRYRPSQTKSGVNGSFFLYDVQGQKHAIFKPMNMEAGAPKNHRLDAAHNVQFRRSILPGQGAGNEVLAYALDKYAFERRYEIPKTILIRLNTPEFEGEELGSAQKFLTDTKPLADMNSAERALIPGHEWEKLNFRLISGSTDAHCGNILYNPSTRKLYLIDSGDDFVGAEGQCQYYCPWVAEPKAQCLMSNEEYTFLASLDIKQVMAAFEKQALANERQSPILKVSTDKYLTQLLRTMLAKIAGQFRLTQAEWFDIINRHRSPDGTIYSSSIETIYEKHLKKHCNPGMHWVDSTKDVNWKLVRDELEYHARMRINRRVA